jgi:hypothetical protein
MLADAGERGAATNQPVDAAFSEVSGRSPLTGGLLDDDLGGNRHCSTHRVTDR